MGTDCSIINTPTQTTVDNKYTSKLFYPGHFETFDGAIYNNHIPGEQTLISAPLSSGTNVKVNVLQVPNSEFYNSVGAQSVGIQVGEHTAVVSVLNGVASTYIDGEPVVAGDGVTIDGDIQLVQVSTTGFQVKAGDEMTIDIDTYEDHLDVSVEASPSLCDGSSGMLSSCNGNSSDDFVTASGETLMGSTLSTLSIHENFAESFTTSGSSMFSSILPVSNAGGYGLKTNRSNMVTETLNSFTETKSTFEIKFKLKESTTECQTIYSNKVDEDVFSTLICDGSISMHRNGEIINLESLLVEEDRWYDLGVVWNNDTRMMTTYLIRDDLQMSQDVKVIPADDPIPVKPGGDVMLGQWNYPSDDRTGVNWNCICEFDDLRIWKDERTVNEIRQNAFSVLSGSEEGLSNNWNMNSGTGSTLTDSVGGLEITMPNEPWSKPERILVDYVAEIPDTGIYDVFSHPDDIDPSLTDFCNQAIYSEKFNVACADEGPQVQEYMYKDCIFNGHVLKDTAETMEVILALSEICGISVDDPDSPAKDFCNSFGSRQFPDWTGDSCSFVCVSGTFTNYKCVCDLGYWGATCSDVCPFSRGLPCGGGTCSTVDGTCECLAKFTGADCADCSTGWYGVDCDVALTTIPASSSAYTCSLFGQGHFTMFDGQSYQLETSGEFLFLKNSLLTVYIRHLPCAEHQALCLKQIWIETNLKNFTVASPISSTGSSKFFINEQQIDLSGSLTLTPDVEVKEKSPYTLEIVFGDNVITIKHGGSFLELYAEFKTASCSSTIEGPCGNCDRNVNNDFVLTGGTVVPVTDISKDIINGEFFNNYKIDVETTTGFQYKQDGIEEPKVPSGGSFSLAFNGSGSTSSQLHNIFGSDGSTTLQVKFEPKENENEGLILAYLKEDSVSIYLNDTIHVQWGEQIIDIGYVPLANEWNTVSLAFNNKTNDLKIYVNNDDGIQTMTEVKVESNALDTGGIMKMGKWDDSSAPVDFGTYTGNIGEVKTWNRTLEMFEVLYTADNRVTNEFPELTTNWVFSEGSGSDAVDLVGGNRIALPEEGVFWTQSDMVVNGDVQEVPVDETLKENAKEKCKSLFFDSHLATTCSAMGDGIANYYYDSCVDDIMFKADEQSFTNSIYSFAEYCQTVVEPATHPLAELCDDKTSQYYSEVCIYQCKFGKPYNNECACFEGYWGESCDQECEGGLVDPCNSHGYCQKDTGTCYCDPKFEVETNCATCIGPWVGDNCDEILPIIQNATTTTSTTTTAATTTTEGEVTTETSLGGTGTVASGGTTKSTTTTAATTTTAGISTTPTVPPISTTPETVAKPTTTYTASVFGQGNIQTFNNGFFSFKEPGEFSLMKSEDVSTSPNVQLKNDYCYNSKSVCPTAVSVDYGDNNIVIRSPYTENQDSIVIVDGEILDFGEETEKNVGDLVINRESETEYTITPTTGEYFDVSIRTSDEQLNVQVTTDPSVCETQDSLIGSCNPTDTILDTDPEKFKVPVSDSSFDALYNNNEYGESRNVSTAGSSLYFNNSVVKTGFLKDVISNDQDFTMSVAIKPENNDGGVITTYDTNSEFTTYIDETIKHKIGDQIYDTEIPVIPGEWHEISTSYYSAPSELTTYVTRPDGTTDQKTFSFLDTKPFENNGYIGLGHPVNPPISTTPEPYEQYYIGEMDELKLFDKALDFEEVQEQSFKPIDTGNSQETANLVSYHKFDDPSLTTLKDEMNTINIPVIDYGVLHQPIKSQFSTAPFEPPEIPAFHSFTDYSDQIEAVDKCSSLITNSDLGTQAGPSSSMLSFYEATCISDAAGAGSLDAALPVITGMADMSVELGFSEEWPAQSLCNEFSSPFPGYIGDDCSIPCDHGSSDGGSSCICDTGYWGSSCSNICPGGASNPCNSHGKCDTATGQCECQTNWAAPNCTTCKEGWYGVGCSISVQPKVPGQSQYYGGITGNGHVSTLDGAGFNFQGQGIYSGYNNPSLGIDVQVQTGATENFNTAVTGIAVQTPSDTVTFSPVNDGTVFVNGEEKVLGTSLSLSNGYSITPMDSDVYKMQHSSNGFEMTVTASNDYMNVDMSTPQSGCSGSSGLFGSCTPQSHSCGPNDYQCLIEKQGLALSSTSNSLPTSAIDSHLDSFIVPFESSIFKDSNPEIATSVGVTLNNSWVSTMPLSEDFIGENMTVEMTMKIHELDQNGNGGTVMSFSKDSTMGVTIEGGEFNVRVDDVSHPTGIPVQTDQWTTMAMSYNNATGDVRLSYVHDNGVMDSSMVNVGLNLMPERGSLIAGQWQTPPDQISPPPPGVFIGDIDRMLLFDTTLDPAEIMLHSQIPINGPQDGLTMGFNFGPGEGTVVPDFITGHEMSMSPDGASWVPTAPPYMQMNAPTTEMGFEMFGAIDEMVKEMCTELMSNSALAQTCGDLPEGKAFFEMACMDDVKVSDKPDFSMDSMMAFGGACDTLMGPSEPPTQSMCNDFPNRDFPVWNGDDCNQQCMQGNWDPATNECTCHQGFSGPTCSNTCPGGISRPCNLHGNCNSETNTCICESNWQGTPDCSSCTTGYYGQFCEHRMPDIPQDSPMACMAEMQGKFTNFTGYGLQTFKTGTYVMFHTNNFHLEVSFDKIKNLLAHQQIKCWVFFCQNLPHNLILTLYNPCRDKYLQMLTLLLTSNLASVRT